MEPNKERINRTGKAEPKPTKSSSSPAQDTRKPWTLDDDNCAKEGDDEDEDFQIYPFLIQPHVRERILLLYVGILTILVRTDMIQSTVVALEFLLFVYCLLRFLMPLVVEVLRMFKRTSGYREEEDEITRRRRRTKRDNNKNDNNNNRNSCSNTIRRSIDMGSRDCLNKLNNSSSMEEKRGELQKMSAVLSGIVNEAHKNMFVESVVDNSSSSVVWEKIHTGSIQSEKFPTRYRMYCQSSSSQGKIARIKTEIAIDCNDHVEDFAGIVAKVQLDEKRRNKWGDASTTSRILATDDERNVDLIFWRVNYPRLMAPRDYLGIRRIWRDEATRSTISVCVDANGSEEAHKKKKHIQLLLGGGGFDVSHLYSAALIQPKYDDELENGAMLVSTYAEAPGVPKKLVLMTAAKGLDAYMLSFHRELRREIRIRKRSTAGNGLQSVRSFDSNNSNHHHAATEISTSAAEDCLFEDEEVDILDEEEKAVRRKLRESPLHLRRNVRFFKSIVRNSLRKLANTLEEKEEREKLKFKAAATLTSSEKEQREARQQNGQRRRTVVKRWAKRSLFLGVGLIAKVLKADKED